MTAPLRIVHCDDSEDVIGLVDDWFGDHPDLDLVASALGMQAALEQAQARQPDAIVTDTMGLIGGETYLRMLRGAAPHAAIVLYTGYERFQLRPTIVELVDRIVTKDIDETELVAALRDLPRR
jgi:DNA-binding NarL/FixJ family response regulator